MPGSNYAAEFLKLRVITQDQCSSLCSLLARNT